MKLTEDRQTIANMIAFRWLKRGNDYLNGDAGEYVRGINKLSADFDYLYDEWIMDVDADPMDLDAVWKHREGPRIRAMIKKAAISRAMYLLRWDNEYSAVINYIKNNWSK
jgi:hypothetical protein